MACHCHLLAFNRYQRDIREAIKLGEADIAYRMTRHLVTLANLLVEDHDIAS